MGIVYSMCTTGLCLARRHLGRAATADVSRARAQPMPTSQADLTCDTRAARIPELPPPKHQYESNRKRTREPWARNADQKKKTSTIIYHTSSSIDAHPISSMRSTQARTSDSIPRRHSSYAPRGASRRRTRRRHAAFSLAKAARRCSSTVTSPWASRRRDPRDRRELREDADRCDRADRRDGGGGGGVPSSVVGRSRGGASGRSSPTARARACTRTSTAAGSVGGAAAGGGA